MKEKCSTCSRIQQAPPRSKVTGLRAEHFGDLIFIDHTEFKLIMKDGTSASFLVLVGLDAATNLLFAIGVKDNLTDTTLAALEEMFILWNINPKAVCADSAFFKDSFMPYWNYKGCRPLPTGPNTPWPNRAETAVKLFQNTLKQIAYTLHQQEFLKENFLTARMLILRACWARNNSLTYGGKTPLECAYGRRPPDVFNVENESFGSHCERLSARGLTPDGFSKTNVSKHADF